MTDTLMGDFIFLLYAYCFLAYFKTEMVTTYHVINKLCCFIDIKFDECGISALTVNALTDAGYVQTTGVQETAFPMCLESENVLVKAKIGTGKSAAFSGNIHLQEDTLPGRHKALHEAGMNKESLATRLQESLPSSSLLRQRQLFG
ncbi:hypothetical protein EE612_014588 [Oryza sativa]|nr:hypothetical protein EE612_014588 [Oryza sativa]